MKLKGRIEIATCTPAHGDPIIEIRVEDEDSHISFFSTKMSLRDFTLATMGHRSVPIEFEAVGLDKVGKIRETKELIFPVSKRGYNQKKEAEAKCQNWADKGWTASGYFGSQNSFFDKGNKTYARTTQHRWVKRKA